MNRASLASANAAVAAEWHPVRNGDLTPSDVTPGSHQSAWWQCERGHEWQAIISNRNRGRGCPHCDGRVVGYGNSLADLHPALSAQWHSELNEGLAPSDVTPGSQRKVWWQCDAGHDWQATISTRTAGSGCPYCSGLRVGYGNSLADLNPTLAAQWHPTLNGDLLPSQVRPGTNRKAWWRCSAGHEWQAVVGSRNGGIGCPYCSGKRAGYGNSLADLNPELATQWHPTLNGDLLPSQ
ncbi:MAG TPA: zinc-ribbon domain-containing protein, partial [Mycobacteriales bacterium]|nr:zinc-ribbon domain-containing protein [Mycobacteriales bacterium]